LENVVSSYRGLIARADWSSEIPVFSTKSMSVWHTRMAIFSDSIFLWAKAEPVPVCRFLNTCSVLMAESIKAKWPLRGGIACGRCVVNQGGGLFVGAPIVVAAELEKAQRWVGAALNGSCIDHPTCGPYVESHEDVCRYDVPISTGKRGASWAVKWKSRDPWTEEAVKRLSEKAPEGDRGKYSLTLEFLRSH